MAIFHLKQFDVDDHGCGMKICSDSVLLGAWLLADAPATVVDLGAGSGLLALMCAQRFPKAIVMAVEIDTSAAEAARANFEASQWASRLSIDCADAQQWQPALHADLIVCNPPYFSAGLLSPDAARAAARHASTLGPLQAIDLAASWLSADGQLAMVTPADGLQTIISHAEMRRLKLRRLCIVSTSTAKPPTRALWQFSRQDGPIERSYLSLRLSGGSYTPEYRSLTSDFYLNF